MKSVSCRPTHPNRRRMRQQYYHHTPRVNVYKSAGDLYIEMAIPGLDKSAIIIESQDGDLIVRHNGEVSQDKKYIQKGFDLRGFSRRLTLPRDIDTPKISATFDTGVLTIHLPILEEAKPRTITIQ